MEETTTEEVTETVTETETETETDTDTDTTTEPVEIVVETTTTATVEDILDVGAINQFAALGTAFILFLFFLIVCKGLYNLFRMFF